MAGGPAYSEDVALQAGARNIRSPQMPSDGLQDGPFVWQCLYLDNTATVTMDLTTTNGTAAVAATGVTLADGVIIVQFGASATPKIGLLFDNVRVLLGAGTETQAVLRSLQGSLYLHHKPAAGKDRYLSLYDYTESYAANVSVSEAAATAVYTHLRGVPDERTLVPLSSWMINLETDVFEIVPRYAVNSAADIPVLIVFENAIAWDTSKYGIPNVSGCGEVNSDKSAAQTLAQTIRARQFRAGSSGTLVLK